MFDVDADASLGAHVCCRRIRTVHSVKYRKNRGNVFSVNAWLSSQAYVPKTLRFLVKHGKREYVA